MREIFTYRHKLLLFYSKFALRGLKFSVDEKVDCYGNVTQAVLDCDKMTYFFQDDEEMTFPSNVNSNDWGQVPSTRRWSRW